MTSLQSGDPAAPRGVSREAEPVAVAGARIPERRDPCTPGRDQSSVKPGGGFIRKVSCPFSRMNHFILSTHTHQHELGTALCMGETEESHVPVPRAEGFIKTGMGWWTTLFDNQTAGSCQELTQDASNIPRANARRLPSYGTKPCLL